MRNKLLISLFLLIALISKVLPQIPTAQKLDPNMTVRIADADGIVWFDPREAPFELTGFEWIKEDTVYRRLPVNPEWEIRDAVDQLANHTAGGQIRFSSDSRRVQIKVELREKSGMYHMPATGQSGFDLYIKESEGQRYFRTTRFREDSIRYQAELFTADDKKMRTFTLNFPLYNGVNSVQIGVDQESAVEAPPAFQQRGKVVIYGTSITQGGCVGRPGMAFSNILSRKLDMQFVNLGFSGNGKGEPALAHLITQISGTRCIVLDYEANAGISIKESLGPFVDVLRKKHPDTPILIMSKIRYASAIEGSASYKEWIHLRDFQRDLVKKRKFAGDKRIYFLDGSNILGDDYDECTVDGVHPNDLGSLRIANALRPHIENILSDNPVSSREDVDLFNFWRSYSDPEQASYNSSCSLAFRQLQERKETLAGLQVRSDYLSRQDSVRKRLLKLIGPFPEKTPLNVRVTEVIEKEDYRVEKVIYESMPGYYVTAALFIPRKLKGKAPAIIYASGHTSIAFRATYYQHSIINLVKKGFIVLAYDPIGQGERLQYTDEDGKARFGSTTEHSYAGAQCFISGYSPLKYFIWDGIRSLDYLLTRKEVDPERIGMTGRSGGGTQTAFTAAVDERIKAAAPECYITSMERLLQSIGLQDAEQNLYHMTSAGLDHADLLEVRAPKPCLMITTTRDFFSIQGARETFDEAKHFYKGLGAGDLIGMVEDDDVHASTKKNREAMYAFFQKYLENPGNPEDLEVGYFKEEELWVTPTGQVATSLKGETMHSLNRKTVRNQHARLKWLRGHEDFNEHATRVEQDAKQLSGYEDPAYTGGTLFSGRLIREQYTVEKYLIPGTGKNMLPVVLFKPVENHQDKVVLLLDEQGMEHAAQSHHPIIQSILNQGYSVLLFDVRGTGSLGPGPWNKDEHIDHRYFNQWFAGIISDKSTVGMRAEDIVRITRFVTQELEGNKEILALSIGATGSELLHAALFEKKIQRVCLVEPYLSFADVARSPEYSPRIIPSTVPGAIEKYDLPDLMAAISPRRLMIINPLSPTGEPADKDQLSCNLSYPDLVYEKHGVKDLFIHSGNEDQLVYDQLVNWLK
ncbi:MAG: SGNH/GDSL hydrolase N-terminal domain-containing protein [Bacteroidota bacterium]